MKFNSQALQHSFDQVKPLLDNLKRHDPLSEDIQKLELLLKTLQLKESFIFNLNFIDTPIYQEELLIWDHYLQRLIYTRCNYKVSCLSHDKGYFPQINYNDKEILLEIPLAETTLEIKQKISQEDKLALFLSLLTQRFHQPKKEFIYFN